MTQETAPISILFVDDEDSFRLTLAMVLRSNGFKVEECDSGESAVEFLSHRKFDVVILDYHMPGMSGLNVLQWMHEQKMETPVVMLTAAGTEAIAVEVMKFGAYDYLRKESIELDHLPIVIKGAHERCLFKKEKQMREKVEQERENNRVAIEMFHSTLLSLTYIANNTLSLLSLNIEEYNATLLPYVKEEGREQFKAAFSDIAQGFSVISSSVRSMLNLSSVVHEKIAGTNETRGMEENLQQKMKELQEQHRQTMDQ